MRIKIYMEYDVVNPIEFTNVLSYGLNDNTYYVNTELDGARVRHIYPLFGVFKIEEIQKA